MGDFILDFRDRSRRGNSADSLRFYPDMEVDCIDRDLFALFVSRTGRADLWAPFVSPEGVTVALAGRIAMESRQWDATSRLDGKGGLACKAIYQTYRDRGIEGLADFSGGFAIHLYDPCKRCYWIVTDGAGAFPCYSAVQMGELLCSHPDVLAQLIAGGSGRATTSSSDWDLISLAQFIATGVVSSPHSYYQNISALDFGCIHTFDLSGAALQRRTSKKYQSSEPITLSESGEDEIAERIADGIVAASRVRTLPILGRTAVALSGGLDSRAILCGAERHPELIAFCAFDQRNDEFNAAKAIADALSVTILPFPRPFEHYGSNAEMGVRISGGMGELTSNHFLGFRERFKELGIENLVTGCYFDYLFKSLALDAREQGILRIERFVDFSFQSYLPHFEVASPFGKGVRSRLNELFSEADRDATTPLARARIAVRRVFPLYHEGDNMQRLVPQRVMNWSTPSIDPHLLQLSRIMPPEMKLNARVFRMAVQRVCGKTISQIPDNNTGLPLSASRLRVAINRYRIALRRRAERRSMSIATAESWPNWGYYIRSSKVLQELWRRSNPIAREVITELSGEPFREDPSSYCDRPTQYFMRLLTLKIWLDQRSCPD